MNRRTSRRRTFLSAALILVFPIAGRMVAQEAVPPSAEPPPLTGGLYPELDEAAADAQAAFKKLNAAEDEYRKNPSKETKQERDTARAEYKRKDALARFRIGQFVLLSSPGDARSRKEELVNPATGKLTAAGCQEVFKLWLLYKKHGLTIRNPNDIHSADLDLAEPTGMASYDSGAAEYWAMVVQMYDANGWKFCATLNEDEKAWFPTPECMKNRGAFGPTRKGDGDIRWLDR